MAAGGKVLTDTEYFNFILNPLSDAFDTVSNVMWRLLWVMQYSVCVIHIENCVRADPQILTLKPLQASHHCKGIRCNIQLSRCTVQQTWHCRPHPKTAWHSVQIEPSVCLLAVRTSISVVLRWYECVSPAFCNLVWNVFVLALLNIRYN